MAPSGGSIRAAAARASSEAFRRHLEGSQLVAGLWCNGLTTREFRGLRGALPPNASLLVAKPAAVNRAVSGTHWSALSSCARGLTAWLFVRGDNEIAAALKPCRDFQKQSGFHDFTGAVFEGRLYGPEEFSILESMPTRAEMCEYLLGCLHLPAASLISAIQASQEGEDTQGGDHKDTSEAAK